MAVASAPRGFRQRIDAILHSRFMPLWMVVVSFLENSIMLFPMEPLFIPVMAARRKQAFFLAGLLTLGCVLGAGATYVASAWLFDAVVEPLMYATHVYAEYELVQGDIRDNGFWAMFLIGVTPVPFQLGTVAAGVAGMPFGEFLLAVALSRGLRYNAVAALVYVIGAKAEVFIEKYEVEIAVGSVLLFVALFGGGWLVSNLFLADH